MCRFYEQGYTGLEIEQMLGTPRSVVYRTLRQGTVIRPFTESNRRVSVNHDAFSVITEESAYWIGFLLTDGCVYDNDIELGLASIDKGHLQKFLDFLDADYPIRDRAPSGYPGSTGSSRVKVTSAQLVKDLASFGVVPRKSSVVSAAEPLLYNAAFWRGCVDGDGWVIVGKTAGTDTVGLTGTYELCRQFLAFTESVCQGKRSVSTNGEKLSQLTVRGAQAAVLLDRLYGGAQVYLDRKREKALTILGRAPGC
jgi:hypothetical protein